MYLSVSIIIYPPLLQNNYFDFQIKLCNFLASPFPGWKLNFSSCSSSERLWPGVSPQCCLVLAGAPLGLDSPLKWDLLRAVQSDKVQ
jgi:hypothetical protein